MKKLIWIFVLIVAVIIVSVALYVANCFYNISVNPKALSKESIVVVYAIFKHNALGSPLIVQEVWKDNREAHSPLVGRQLANLGTLIDKPIPEGAVVFIVSTNNLNPREYVLVRNGMVTVETKGNVEVMTLTEYKKLCGF